jgi:hypothetical protein
MAKILILANFELALEANGDDPVSQATIRAKERRILRFLRKLTAEEPGITGTVETLEFESFTTDELGNQNPASYYYNKTEHQPDAPAPGSESSDQ